MAAPGKSIVFKSAGGSAAAKAQAGTQPKVPNQWTPQTDPIVNAGPAGTGLHLTRSGRYVNSSGFYSPGLTPQAASAAAINQHPLSPPTFGAAGASLSSLISNVKPLPPKQSKTKAVQPPSTQKRTIANTTAVPTKAPPASTPPSNSPPRKPAQTKSTNTPTTPAGTTYTPMTAEQMIKAAQQIAKLGLAPLLANDQSQITAANDQSAAHDKTVAGFATALAELLQPIAGNVSGAYGDAADAVAGYGKGFSDLNTQTLAGAGAAASTANPNLTSAQQTAIASGYAGMPHDVLYGLTGDNPATSLRNVGSGLNSILAKLPAVAGAYGNEWLAASQAQALKNLQGLQNQTTRDAAQFPQLYQSALTNLQDQNLKNASFQLAAGNDASLASAREAGVTGYYMGADGQMHPTASTVRTNNSDANAKARIKAQGVKSQQLNATQLKTLNSLAGELREGKAPHYHYDSGSQSWLPVPGTDTPKTSWPRAIQRMMAAGAKTRAQAVSLLDAQGWPEGTQGRPFTGARKKTQDAVDSGLGLPFNPLFGG